MSFSSRFRYPLSSVGQSLHRDAVVTDRLYGSGEEDHHMAAARHQFVPPLV